MPALVRAAFPNIIIPGRYGVQRPRWPFTINRDSPQAVGLLAWYPGMVAAGSTLIEMGSGIPGNDGTLTAGASFVTDVERMWVIDLDGTNDLVSMDGLITLLANETVGYISLWVNVDTDDGAENHAFVISRDADGTRTEFYVNYDLRAGADRFDIRCRADGTDHWRYQTALESTDAHIGKWLLIEVVQDGTEPKIFLNGEQDTGGSFTIATDKTKWFKAILTDATSPSDTANLGVNEINGSDLVPFDGKVCDLRIGTNITPSGLARQKWNPQTRWDLYYELGRVFYSFAAGAVAFVPYPNPRYALTGGMQPMDGGV